MEADPMTDIELGNEINTAAMGDSMDDLFGEAADGLDLAAVGVRLPVINLPPTPALLRRIAEMQSTGCCTKLAWSNFGSIAQVSADGRKVTFYMFTRTSTTSRDWSLSRPSQHEIKAPDQECFVHLQFNHIGQDLAILNNRGQISIYSAAGGIGKMNKQQISTGMPTTELDIVVGLHWLPLFPLDCRSMYIGPASRTVSGWTSQFRSRDGSSVKVHHPGENARALLYVTKTGKITLVYQQDGWKTLSKSLGTYSSSDTLLTHADMCEHHGGLLLVSVDVHQRLKVFSIRLDWNASVQQLPTGQQQVLVAPTLHINTLAMLPDSGPQSMENAKLVQLSVMPAPSEVVDATPATTTTVLATYIKATIPADAVTQFPEASTILVRWQVESEMPTLHGGFKNLKPGAQSTNTAGLKTVLRRQPDLTSQKIIFSVQSRYFDTILACTASDGTVEYRDRATFEILESYMDDDHVNSLPQSGFSYVSGEHIPHAAISYDGSAMVVSRSSGKLDVLTMSYQYGWQRIDESTGSSTHAEAAIVCIARQWLTLIYANISPDDLLCLLPSTLPEDLQQLLIREAFRFSRQTPDISAFEEQKRQQFVMREQIIPRIYSLQLYLGLKPSGRSFTSQYAWALLNLRHICMSVTQIVMRIDLNKPFSADLIHSLRGHARYGVDLFLYILNALLCVKDIATRDLSQPARDVFEKYMLDNNNPAFLLLLCSYTRTLLKILAQSLPRLIILSARAGAFARTVTERQELQDVGLMGQSLPFTFDTFRAFLDKTEGAMNAGSGPPLDRPSQGQPSTDMIMAISGRIPAKLEQPLRALLISEIPSLLQGADLSQIYFADGSWLGFDGKKSMELAMTYDVLKKTLLPPGASLRKCRRCGSVMEDVNIDRPREVPPWLAGAQRYCLCTCTWFVP